MEGMLCLVVLEMKKLYIAGIFNAEPSGCQKVHRQETVHLLAIRVQRIVGRFELIKIKKIITTRLRVDEEIIFE